MTQPAILAEALTYSYNGKLAVDHISFQVAEGEILGFLGPNGAGKSTTVKMLTGQLVPQTGRAFLLGIDVARHPKQVQAQIGVCFEITNLYEPLSALDNLKLFSALFNVRNFDAMALLRRVGLEAQAHEQVERFSKGMKQRLMIARALVNRPKILFLDEPTEGLDPVSAQAIRQLILEERARGATVFLTTHDMVEADKLCDRVAFINQGRIVALDAPATLKQAYGKRILRAQVRRPNGEHVQSEIMLDQPDTERQLQALFASGHVLTLHSEEATLEDIFIRVTGRGLA